MAGENETPQSTVVEHPGGPGPGDTGVRNALERVTLNLTPRSVRALNNLVTWTDYTKTDTINRALQIYEFIQEIMDKGGTVHVRRTEDGELERLTFF